ncbi:hypothetical protein E2F43_14625 [Seongchinamella unica]|uniref:Transporter n=1 Tax=Seongchinamella unica TaxID=2547392 RepID=A0A4R5LQM7_9GAMM|nr:hypothetical protein [Seongchinamella unica]TDG12795.1 hypothetical protein E2F43_14625 [Seongchinamella unica]
MSKRLLLLWRLGLAAVLPLSLAGVANAQQFAGDNQWVAPHGVATIVGTVGEEYSQFYAVAALIPEWEFNLQLTHYYDDPRDDTDDYTATSLFAKYRISESEDEKTGYSVVFGTGLTPEHKEEGEVNDAFESWWALGTATYAFADNSILLDVLPGFTYNVDREQHSDSAWGFTYMSRVAVYDIIPQSAIVGEVFGTAGEAFAEPSYRLGVRWESPRWVAALTYSDAFDGSYGAGVEFGVFYLTDPRFCLGGCR